MLDVRKYQLIYVQENLYQIKALKDFSNIKKGDLGGFVSSHKNLSQSGNCWIYDNACAFNNSKINDNCKIFNNVIISQNARISDCVEIYNDCKITGNAYLKGNIKLFGNCWILGNIKIDNSENRQIKNINMF